MKRKRKVLTELEISVYKYTVDLHQKLATGTSKSRRCKSKLIERITLYLRTIPILLSSILSLILIACTTPESELAQKDVTTDTEATSTEDTWMIAPFSKKEALFSTTQSGHLKITC